MLPDNLYRRYWCTAIPKKRCQRPATRRIWIIRCCQYGSERRSMVTPLEVEACMKKSPRIMIPTW